ncbi:uncharacterized protein LOC131889819 [Tigriopus californicus]|nr:uncharacterized protein LOC131889819 [Tigriopus californicus]|eukprot:TCALIF_09770-PA protein Name:"Protein of unknown function" AED:0.41 eAED:0.42 QI:119/1/0.5/1/0/0.5/2/0/351
MNLIFLLPCVGLLISGLKADPTPAPKSDHHNHHFTAAPFHHVTTPSYGAPPPPPPPAPAYHQPAPQHNYGYQEPQPYIVETQTFPQQNCSVVDEVVKAEICIPDFSTECGEQSSMTKRLETGEFCYNITRTVCTQTETTSDIEVCDVNYDRSESPAKAKTVEVKFNKECQSNKVTVCQEKKQEYPSYDHPYNNQYGNGGHHYNAQYEYGTVQECQEVDQETCYNIPSVEEVEVDVMLAFPAPSRNCETQTVTIPEVKCEDIVEQKCQNIPRIVEAPDNFERCEVKVGEPKCEEIELVLPKQICTDIIYGLAEVPYEPEYGHPQPAYESHPHQPYANVTPRPQHRGHQPHKV